MANVKPSDGQRLLSNALFAPIRNDLPVPLTSFTKHAKRLKITLTFTGLMHQLVKKMILHFMKDTTLIRIDDVNLII